MRLTKPYCRKWLWAGLVCAISLALPACIEKVTRVCETNASCLTDEPSVCYLQRCHPKLCEPGESQLCYPGSPGQVGGGTCQQGIQICQHNGSAWSPCMGYTLPREEICDGLDNNCDGQIDEGLKCACSAGSWRRCYPGPTQEPVPGTPCGAGVQYCTMARLWGPCTLYRGPGEQLRQLLTDPQQRAVATKQVLDCIDTDRDCDGELDPGFSCTCRLGDTRPCYAGPPGTADQGLCKAGLQSCIKNADGKGQWGFCEKQVLPIPEEFGECNGKDDDCDGMIDHQTGTSALLWKSCGPASECRVQICRDGAWGLCQSQEICANAIDDDCDGAIDEAECQAR